MSKKYKLMYGFSHCKGNLEFCDAIVDTEEEAIRWVKDMERDNSRLKKMDETGKTCPVTVCNLRIQSPWIKYVEIED